jgi:hypothetical protein
MVAGGFSLGCDDAKCYVHGEVDNGSRKECADDFLEALEALVERAGLSGS